METRIGISDLRSEGGDVIKELAEFIKEKTNADVKTETSEIIVKGEGKPIQRTYIRVLLRKFLHRKDLRDTFKIIGGKENALVIKMIKIEEEEEE